ncbi:MAG: hypothetical protein M0Z61_17365 [Nitrospiraceae bacterium]|nr:hypothetical protein [Nitrospiraceae bacterium]
MNIDWQVVATIAAPIITLFLGFWLNQKFESRPVLISYYGHVSTFTVRPPSPAQPYNVNAHSIMLKNAGRRPATNVYINHHVLPDFNIWPHVNYRVENLPDTSRAIIMPTLVPNELITISYMYPPSLTADKINADIKYDQGIAKRIPVLLQRQYPKWFNIAAVLLFFIGIVASLYLGFNIVRSLIKVIGSH